MSSKPSSFDKVRGGKLVFKGVGDVSKLIKKKKKKQKAAGDAESDPATAGAGGADGSGGAGEGAGGNPEQGGEEFDTGIGFAPDGRKKTPKYEEMFPFESVKYAYTLPEKMMKAKTREDALDERAKKKADKFCK